MAGWLWGGEKMGEGRESWAASEGGRRRRKGLEFGMDGMEWKGKERKEG